MPASSQNSKYKQTGQYRIVMGSVLTGPVVPNPVIPNVPITDGEYHHYVALIAPDGTVIHELDGQSFNTATGSIDYGTHPSTDQIRGFLDAPGHTHYSADDPTLTNLYSGSRNDVLARFNVMEDASTAINNSHIPYPALGVLSFNITNSNAFASTIIKAAGLTEPYSGFFHRYMLPGREIYF